MVLSQLVHSSIDEIRVGILALALVQRLQYVSECIFDAQISRTIRTENLRDLGNPRRQHALRCMRYRHLIVRFQLGNVKSVAAS
jgi:hypothetical protein